MFCSGILEPVEQSGVVHRLVGTPLYQGYHLVVTEFPGTVSACRDMYLSYSVFNKHEWPIHCLLGHTQPHIDLWNVPLPFKGIIRSLITPYATIVVVHHPTDVERSLIAEENVPALQPHRGRNTLTVLQHNPLLSVCVASGYGRLSFLFQCEM